MLRLLGFLYSIGLWGTFAFLIYAHWRSACTGIGGCAVTVGVDFLMSLVWPFFWGGWIR
jgi:hypothetical protein